MRKTYRKEIKPGRDGISEVSKEDFYLRPRSDTKCKHITITHGSNHGLRTPNERINQRNLKFWADVADKMCFGRTYKFGIGI